MPISGSQTQKTRAVAKTIAANGPKNRFVRSSSTNHRTKLSRNPFIIVKVLLCMLAIWGSMALAYYSNPHSIAMYVSGGLMGGSVVWLCQMIWRKL